MQFETFIKAIHGNSMQVPSSCHSSPWSVILKEVSALKSHGVDLLSHCKIRVGSGRNTRFWSDVWLGESRLSLAFPRLYALETFKECTVASKFQGTLFNTFRREVRGGAETQQLTQLQSLVETVILSNADDRWIWDLNGEGTFCVKDARNLIDEVFLPKAPAATRWLKLVPIKVNIFVWKLQCDRLPTRNNLVRRGVHVPHACCPVCETGTEDVAHLFFLCEVARDVSRLICRWWNISWMQVGSFAEWLDWFTSIRLGSRLKSVLEGVFLVAWWSIWGFRNQHLFSAQKPRRHVLFDDIVTRSFIWIQARCKSIFTWDSWLQHPYLLSL
ncbi:RNA-directed DNA polymerase, eukaryota [Tanacetum coccineum]